MKIPEEFRLKNFGFNHPEEWRFYSSEWPMPHWFFVIWRLIATFIYMTVLLYTASNKVSEGVHYLIYLNNLALLLLVCQMWIENFAVFVYPNYREQNLELLKGRTLTHAGTLPPHPDAPYDLPRFLRFSWFLHAAVSSLVSSAAMDYWIFLQRVKGWQGLFQGLEFLPVWSQISGAVYVHIHTLVNATPIRIYHSVYGASILLVYFLFNVIYWAVGGTNDAGEPFIYAAIDWGHRPGAAAGYVFFSIFVAQPIGHVILYGLYRLRLYCAGKCYAWYRRRQAHNEETLLNNMDYESLK